MRATGSSRSGARRTGARHAIPRAPPGLPQDRSSGVCTSPPDGRLWVEVERAFGNLWEVFDVDGRLLASVPRPPKKRGVAPAFSASDHLLTIRQDSVDLDHVDVWLLERGSCERQPKVARARVSASTVPLASDRSRPDARIRSAQGRMVDHARQPVVVLGDEGESRAPYR